jgi:hypothetical protein
MSLLPIILETRTHSLRQLSLKYNPIAVQNRMRPAIEIHTCTLDIDVTIDQDVVSYMLEPTVLDDKRTTEFDLWWHSHFLNAAHSYNAL